MKKKITVEHKKKLAEMKKDIAAIGSKEANFTRMKLLFFNTITMARNYGDDPSENNFLAALKQLQVSQFRETQTKFSKQLQREKVIGRFSNQLRGILAAAIKNDFFTPAIGT